MVEYSGEKLFQLFQRKLYLIQFKKFFPNDKILCVDLPKFSLEEEKLVKGLAFFVSLADFPCHLAKRQYFLVDVLRICYNLINQFVFQ